MGYISAVSARHRKVLIFSAFVVAFLFPFTQGGSDANMSIATQVIIFAATAMGLNIVVGLAGLLDLGYIAFLGAGAFTAAILSRVGVLHRRLASAVHRGRPHQRNGLGHSRPDHRFADAARVR